MTMLSEVHHDLSDLSGPLRIGVLSDTHGEIAKHVLEQLKGSDVILHAGDVCGQEVLDSLAAITTRVIAVAGNNDQSFNYANGPLPDLAHVQLPGGRISLLHGHQFGLQSPSHDAMRDSFVLSHAIVYGHSHRQVHDVTTLPTMLNPGAAGSTRTNGGAACATVAVDPELGWDVRLYQAS